MITRLRKESKKILRPIASALSKLGISANLMTIIGLVLALLYFIIIMLFRNPLYGLVLIIFSSLADALDGEIARITGKAGVLGSFLDSSLDRIEDTLFLSALCFLGFQSYLVAILVGLSLIIPYLRAKAESLGIKAEGKGIIERGERLIFIMIILLISMFYFQISTYIFYIFIILSAITVIQRFFLVSSSLPK
ncbi:archaetidylinositol phosphate synthase [Acidianus brierleyi]|uniref:Archaetidylinositol phosphate synthase n=1 Tax=Acidianus brierleyi TaxID=41673 RepID=A0A2U9IFM5_9CREN|nr:archaetidylinositol phosphate synthase [Acidianus brierleyi]AWR94819.1 CDP-alcohol phosphatidyltransferase family protein [Acidianus brierleyi]